MTTEIKNIELLEQLKEYGFGRDSLNIMKAFEGIPDFTIKTEVGEYRFIHDDIIPDVLAEELSDDAYALGSFPASFIADILNIPMDSVEKIQGAFGYQALGDAMIRHIDEVANKYASLECYGTHFSHYDESKVLFSNGYYMFRIS